MMAAMDGPSVLLQIHSDPTVPGYNDRIAVADSRLHCISYLCPASGGPNHRQTNARGGGPWQARYPQIAPGTYRYECVEHRKYHKSLLLESGKEVACRAPNPQQHGELFMRGAFLHSGQSAGWRGSAGCPVVHPVFWLGFLFFFKIGQRGRLYVVDY